MSTYLGTALFILMILNGLLGLSIYVMILFLIISFRQTNQLSMAIIKAIKK